MGSNGNKILVSDPKCSVSTRFSLTSLRKYQRINNIVIHHPTNKGTGQSAAKKAAAATKKATAAKNKAQQQQVKRLGNDVASFEERVMIVTFCKLGGVEGSQNL